MHSDKSSLRRLLFACVSLSFCLALALRPVPSVVDSNDTGRYVTSQEESCRSAAVDDDSDAQQKMLNLLMRPACAIGSDRLFLFGISAFLPISLAMFGEWAGRGTLLLAAGLIFSVVGFELATNALRQGVSLAFLIAAASAGWKPGRLLALCMAVLLHTSSWIFVPWVLLLDQAQWGSRKSKALLILMANVSVIAVWHYWDSIVAGLVSDGLELLRTYEEIYSEGGTKAFLLFMLFPTIWVFAVRLIKAGRTLPRAEKLTFLYSAAVLLITVIFFPFITFRVAMTTAVVQIVVAMRATDLPVKSAAWIWGGLAGHLLVYALLSSNMRAVFNV